MIIKVIGRPGTGKTTWLLEWIKQHAEEHIRFFSYGRMVDIEARGRLAKAGYEYLETEKSQNTIQGGSISMSTLHSYAYTLTDTMRQDIITERDYLDFCKLVGLDYSVGMTRINLEEPTSFAQVDEGHKFFAIYDLIRNKMITREDHAKFYFDNGFDADGSYLEERWESWKAERVKVDFTDIIRDAVGLQGEDNPTWIIVDEFQDLSPLQWSLVKTNFVDRGINMIIAGDPYQSIYGFQGADSSIFGGVKEDKLVVLPKSFRMKRNIYNAAHVIFPLEPLEVEEGGNIWIGCNMPLDALIRQLQKDIFILVRTNNIGGKLALNLNDNGIPFSTPLKSKIYSYWNVNKGFSLRELGIAVIQLLHGDAMTNAHLLLKHLKTTGMLQRGAKDLLLKQDNPQSKDIRNHLIVDFSLSLDGVLSHLDMKETTIRILRNAILSGNIIQDPLNVEISTVHGAKGREREHVIFLDEVPLGMIDKVDPQEEKRILYTAFTRAKSTLIVMQPMTGGVSYYDQFYGGVVEHKAMFIETLKYTLAHTQ
jgi:superfamily I DNA/RNA helicase